MKYGPEVPPAKRHDLNRQRATRRKCAAIVVIHAKPLSCRSIKRARIQARKRRELAELKSARPV